MADEMAVRCTDCRREVDEFTTIAERWMYFYEERDLFPYCPGCAKREFAEDPPAAGVDVPRRKHGKEMG